VIRSLRGRLTSLEGAGAVVEVGGVGLLVRASATTLAALPPSGGQVTLETHLVVREDALDLYGFAEPGERELFEALLGVGGVGPRMALAICGVASPADLRAAISSGDTARIQSAPGVGKRTAERVVLELRERVGVVSNGSSAVAAGPVAEARAGLAGLGFAPEDVEAALADAPAGLDAEGLLRHGLDRLRR